MGEQGAPPWCSPTLPSRPLSSPFSLSERGCSAGALRGRDVRMEGAPCCPGLGSHLLVAAGVLENEALHPPLALLEELGAAVGAQGELLQHHVLRRAHLLAQVQPGRWGHQGRGWHGCRVPLARFGGVPCAPPLTHLPSPGSGFMMVIARCRAPGAGRWDGDGSRPAAGERWPRVTAGHGEQCLGSPLFPRLGCLGAPHDAPRGCAGPRGAPVNQWGRALPHAWHLPSLGQKMSPAPVSPGLSPARSSTPRPSRGADSPAATQQSYFQLLGSAGPTAPTLHGHPSPGSGVSRGAGTPPVPPRWGWGAPQLPAPLLGGRMEVPPLCCPPKISCSSRDVRHRKQHGEFWGLGVGRIPHLLALTEAVPIP